MTVPLALVRNDDQADHHSPAHPERPDRVTAILERIGGDPALAAVPWLDPGEPSRDLPLLVHTESEVTHVEILASTGGGWFDGDTYCTPRSYQVALSAAACAARAVRAVQEGEALAVFAVVRPPGHHATPTRPMGFCLFNNVAVAVRCALRGGAERVAVLDIDVHHGNGTQDIFWHDPSVLYCSLHQFPWYPGTGHHMERGHELAIGTTLNVPIPGGTRGDAWLERFDAVAGPAMDAFAPDLILVSAGFDAHRDDPLADLELTADTYAAVAARVRRLAEAHCRGRSVWVLEGGYDLPALAESVAACLHALAS